MDVPHRVSEKLTLRTEQVFSTLALLEQGATVPFIARYRKERTGGLDEEKIREVAHLFRSYSDLESRKETIIQSIRVQNKLTEVLEARIRSADSRTELEDLYLPYRPKKITRASRARGAGLEPLAHRLRDFDGTPEELERLAAGFIKRNLGIDTPRKALQGACDILAEILSEDTGVRKWLRQVAIQDGVLFSRVRKKFSALKTKFSQYDDFREKAARIPSHRYLALLRGEKENILRLNLELPLDRISSSLEKRLVRKPESVTNQLLKQTARDALERLLAPSLINETRRRIYEAAEKEAIRVFSENLRELLLAPPLGPKAVLGIDPGFRTGCKVAALDKTGKFLEHRVVFPNEPHKSEAQAASDLLDLISRHQIEWIAIGNGTAGRETADFVVSVLQRIPESRRPNQIMVSEAGASVYSASPTAREEFPDLDVMVRGAISIARRLQDPLSELVKIEPRSLGVGQYQHDVNQTRLKESLEAVVESCVNLVGVNVNLASEELLKYVSGLNRSTAAALVKNRDRLGVFFSREDLKRVPGMGEKTFEQAAGFLRIPGGDFPLDDSAVHPERYGLVKRMAATTGVSLKKLIGVPGLIMKIPVDQFVTKEVGMPTLKDILAELEKPGRDPRDSFNTADFAEDIHDINDLSPDMTLEGSITNVTNFGAFVDVGVHQDGLIHISQISDEYVDDPRRFLKVGQIVRVKVISVDPDLRRISLSLKKTEPVFD